MGDHQVSRVCLLSRLVLPGMGDLVQRNIFLNLLRRTFPHATLTWILAECVSRVPYQYEAVRRHSYADRIMLCPDADEELVEPDPAGWRRFLGQLAGERFEVCVLDPSSRRVGPEVIHDAGVGVRVAVPMGAPDQDLITHPMRLPRPVAGQPDLYDYTCALAGALGVPAPRPWQVVPRLPIEPEELPRWVERRPLVGLHPAGAKGWHRRWPLPSYAELGVRLAAEAGATLVLIGSADEQEETHWLRKAVLERCPSAQVYVSLGERLNRAANLIDRLDLLVGNDSAPAHLAAALSTRTVVIYGPTGTESIWARVYPGHRGVNKRYPCQNVRHAPGEEFTQCEHGCPCHYVSAEGPYPKCLTDITVEDVWQAVLSQLTDGGRS